jgi:hypothetical protein
LKTLNVAALALNAALYVAVGIIFYFVIPIKFEGVRFWPPVVVPAVFAVVFGPWVGGFGAAIGIFLSDIVLGNNPLLSLMAGVTSNFAMFWLIGYVANKKSKWALPIFAYGVVSVLLGWMAYVYAGVFWFGVVAASYLVFVAVGLLSSRWRSNEVGSVIGLMTGSAIIAAMVPLYAQLFTPLGQTPLAPFTLAAGLALFIFTFATEIPFLLILVPPIVEAARIAFPNLKSKTEPAQGDNVEQNR